MAGEAKLRLTHPGLDFYVDVTVHERDGRYMATADLGEDSRDVGVGDTAQEAVRAALRSLGEPYASEVAERMPSLERNRKARGLKEPESCTTSPPRRWQASRRPATPDATRTAP